jgi:hypothetical protein
MDRPHTGEEAPVTGLAWGRRIIQATTMFVVTLLSLLLLLYVSGGDGKRTYEQIHIEKMMANGLVVQTAFENFLREGLQLKQYAGFATLAAPILEGEDLDAMTVYDQKGRQIFQLIDQVIPSRLPDPSEIIKTIKRDSKIEYTATHYQLVIPLRTRNAFEKRSSRCCIWRSAYPRCFRSLCCWCCLISPGRESRGCRSAMF